MAMQARRTGSMEDATYWRSRFEEERRRLAMLWKAFEDAEARIVELEGALRGRPAGASAGIVATIATTATTETTLGEVGVPEVQEVTEVVHAEEGLQPQPRFPVDMYRISKVPGLKTADAEKLRTYGINLTDELLHAELPKLSTATGIPEAKLQHWRDISELMAINGIGPIWAERLVDAEVTSIRQLAELTPQQLEGTLMKSYQRQGADEKKMLLLSRTLPSRCVTLIGKAKKAAKSL